MKEPGPEHRAYTRTAIVTRLRDADNYSYFDACRGADAIEELEAENDALRAKLEALEAHKAAAPLCEKHAPNGGARSGCLVCSGMRLSGALSEIDYICGEPNEYELSQYDADFDEARVVDCVKALRAKLEAMSAKRQAKREQRKV